MKFEASYVFSVDRYLKENYSLFALLGIFSAFTIYLSRSLPTQELGYYEAYLKIGALSSVLLIAYVTVLLNVNAFRMFVERSNFKRRRLPTFGKLLNFAEYLFSSEGLKLLILLLLMDLIAIIVTMIGLLLSDTFYLLSALVIFPTGALLADKLHARVFDAICGEFDDSNGVTKCWIAFSFFPVGYFVSIAVVYTYLLTPQRRCAATLGDYCIFFESAGAFALQWLVFGVAFYALFSIALLVATNVYLLYVYE